MAQLTRRALLTGLAASASPAFGKQSYHPMLGAQFYVWTQQFQREKKGYAEGVPAALAATRRAGFRRVELMSQLFEPALRDITLGALREQGLEAPIVYNGGAMHDEAAAGRAIDTNAALAGSLLGAGVRILNFNPNPIGRLKTPEELETQARNVTRLSTVLREKGVTLILHHHNPEMAENAREWRHLLENTEVPLCIDLHWVLRGGQDPQKILEEAGKRVASIHLRNSQKGVWSESFGAGDIDYARVAAYLMKTGYAGHLVVELAYENATAITRPLEEDLRLSREYAEQVFAVRA